MHFATFVAKCFSTIRPGTPFVENWHILAIAHHLEQVRLGRTKRLLITVPPRSLKSTCASVAFPAFVLGRDPTTRLVCVSYAEDLAANHARDCKAVMISPWYREVFPHTRISEVRSMTTDFETTRKGARIATTVGGTLTGRGGRIIVIDDPQKPADAMSEPKRRSTLDWYRNTLTSRLDDKRNDAIVCVMQRLHVDDLAAHLIETGEWTQLNLPAVASGDQTIDLGTVLTDNGPKEYVKHWKAGDLLHPEFLTQEVLDRQRAEMGSFNFEAQYLQRPVPAQGNLVKWKWFRTYAELPAAVPGNRIVQSWDMGVLGGEGNSWTVCITARVHGNRVHILDVFRKQINYSTQREAYSRLARQHGARVCLVEKAANGHPLIADLRRMTGTGVPSPTPVVPKA